ncbi:hypothetical protein UYO_1257 [Lachnospiraceae bacterium JC7]|nr:hypothetical protein UYO_1257 [Lachnospiraceae bacterium JC7]
MKENIVQKLTSKDDKYACAFTDRIVAESHDTDEWYEYFEDVASLLDHPKSLVRNRALYILAANAQWDEENRFDLILPDYLKHITDEKPITARQCVKALAQVGLARPQYIPQILSALRSADLSKYKDSMRPLIERDMEETEKILMNSGFTELISLNDIFYKMIFKRKSFHIFRNVGKESISIDELGDIQNAYSEFTPLNPEIKTAIRIVPEKQTNCKRGGEYCILLYSEKKDGYLQNIGYLGEQLDLYLVSRNIGTLWFGIGKTEEEPFEDMEFVIMFSIRKISDDSKYRKDMFKSKRKNAEEIWEGEQISGVTDIIRFAPSACNSQPWLVKNDGELLVYRYKKPGKRGIMPADKVLFYNRIDIGIFICFMDLCLEHNGIGFEKTLYSDADDGELVLNAKYRLCR